VQVFAGDAVIRQPVICACMDDKAKISMGVLHAPVQAVVRQQRVLSPIDGGVVCSGHDHSVGGFTASCQLATDDT
jgi:hypothetical protein